MVGHRLALIFDHRARPETTGVYARRALGHLAEVQHVLPSELGRVSRDGFDLCIVIDDGMNYPLPRHVRPCVFWAIDTHIDFDRCWRKGREMDLVFAAQRDGAERLRRAGLNARWLPLACDPEIHFKCDLAKSLEFAFVGNIFPGPRAKLLNVLQRSYPNSFAGNAYFEEMAKTYSSARLSFNRSLYNDVNMRVFEAVACGSLLLTNDLSDNGQDELFQPGVHLETYRDAEELLDKAAFYLAHEEARERIAAAGMAEAHARHTYRHRMETLLQHVESELSRKTVAPAVHLAPGPEVCEPSYFEHARPELLELIPRSASRVLDVGCGAGRLGEALQARQEVEVVGIERNEMAASLAESRLDRVLVGDAERLEVDYPPGHFDAIVCGDILEHLREPERLLRRAREWLRPGGKLIASIPNVRNHSVVSALLEGNWTYESAGLLDRDHVRFFTRREIEKLFFRAGFAIEKLAIVPGPGHQEWVEQGRPGSVRVGRLDVGGLSPEEAEEFYAYQYLVVAAPEVPADSGLTSIVIITHNQLSYTCECLDSLRSRTDEPIELIVVDNASADGTADYLRALPDVRLIENTTNRGFPAAVNQALSIATGRQVVLLNNDTVLTTGWLRRMLRALDSDPQIGLVGPCSNFVGSEQQISVSYDDLTGLDGFAWDLGKTNDGCVVDSNRLIGFCLLIRREVIEEIGTLDERFGIGCYEDDDYCLRARHAGWRTVIARDSFVHHYGSRTFAGSGIDLGEVLQKNQREFQMKWGGVSQSQKMLTKVGPISTQPDFALLPKPEYGVHCTGGNGLLLKRKDVHLSLCMIVRDNSKTIRPCLESIRPWVDEMVVVDTGSTDGTPRMAQEFGARLFDFPWCDDFAAARNESLKHATGEWLFWMDSDDTIDEEQGRQLRALAYGAHDPSVFGYVVRVHCPGAGEDGAFDVTAVDHVKLVRNRPDLRFNGRIHEQLLPAIRRAGGEVAWTDLYVVHSGSDHSSAGQERKLQRDLKLLALELEENPDHPFTLFNLGMTYADCERFEEAVDFLKRSILASGPGESHLRKAYALQAYAQMRLGRRDEARATLQEGRRLFPEDAELQFREGVLRHELGHLEDAVSAYKTVLRNSEERHFSSLDRGITGFKARQNLALVLTEMCQHSAAEEEWRRITDEVPRYRAGWRGLGDCLLRQGRRDAALDLVEHLGSQPGLEGEAWLLAGRIAAADGDHASSREAFEAAIAARPGDAEMRHALCQVLFQQDDPSEAEQCLRELLRIQPDDAAAHHNLGTIYVRQKRYSEAIDAYRKSLRHRPDHVPSHIQLGCALKDAGRWTEAIMEWKEALRLEPGNSSALAELNRAEEYGPTILLPAPLWRPGT